jgi:hypothetical protein
MSTEFIGRYTFEDAKADALKAQTASHNRRHSITNPSPYCRICKFSMGKLPHHIQLPKNDPVPTCQYCGGSGTYYTNNKGYDCLCRMLGREPRPCEINKEFNQQTL